MKLPSLKDGLNRAIGTLYCIATSGRPAEERAKVLKNAGVWSQEEYDRVMAITNNNTRELG